jgi:GNAT superfamily N-acetyltransferase
MIRPWSIDRLEDLVELCGAALPDESVTADDLESLCFGPGSSDADGPLGTTAVLGDDDGAGAVVVTVRRPFLGDEVLHGVDTVGFVQLLVVHPARRRRGLGRALVEASERFAREAGATAMHAGGAAPVYLFTGIDSRWTDALCCFEALGYVRDGAELDLVCETLASAPRSRGSEPAEIVVARAESDRDLAELAAWASARWPQWLVELRRGADAGTVMIARESAGPPGAVGPIVGAAAHSVGRLGVIGPVAVDGDRQGSGVGSALMRAVLADLSAAGLPRAEIAWVSTVRFYARACGARVGRTSWRMVRDLPQIAGG